MHALLARGLMQFGFWSVLSGRTAAVQYPVQVTWCPVSVTGLLFQNENREQPEGSEMICS